MNVNDIIKVAAAIIASLGGGAAIITVVAKWYGDFLAQKMLSNIEHRHEKEIERYKATLQDMSIQFTALVEHSVEVASKQYDMEVVIYQNIWKALHELSVCIIYIYDFENPIGSDLEKYIERLEEHCKDFGQKLISFQEQVDSVAPFYQSNIYELLCQINAKCSELLKIFRESVCVEGMSNENVNRVNSSIKPEIIKLKESLTEMVRAYLFSLQKIPDVR